MGDNKKRILEILLQDTVPRVLEAWIDREDKEGYFDKPKRAIKVTVDVASDTVLGALYPVRKTYDLLRDYVEKKYEKIPEEKLKPPELNVVVPAIQALGYTCQIPELAEMFTNLLISSMNSDKEAHPAFVEIIKQMTSHEARVMNYLANLHKDNKAPGFPIIRIVEFQEPKDFKNEGVLWGNKVRINHLSAIYELAELEGTASSVIILENLVRLQLIEIEYGAIAYDPGRDDNYFSRDDYEKLTNSAESEIQRSGMKPRDGYSYGEDTGVVMLTSFGKEFISCTIDLEL